MDDRSLDGPREGLTPYAAAGVALGAVVLTGIVARRYSPTPDHPGIQSWYAALDKPRHRPPDALVGGGWGVFETCLAIAGYQLLRRPSSPARNAALALWALNFATIAGWAKLFFGDRDLDAASADIVVEVLAAIGLTIATARVDPAAAKFAGAYAIWATLASTMQAEVWRRNA